MNKAEMKTFQEEMEQIGDHWTLAEIEDCYGDTSLSEAIAQRKAEVGTFLSTLGRANEYLRNKDN